MINVLICGISKEMGKRIYLYATNNEPLNIVCGVDSNFNSDIEFNCPIYSSFDDVKEIVDVVIDLSSNENICDLIEFAVKNKCAAVFGAPSYTSKQKNCIIKASEKIPLFLSANISIGSNLLLNLCSQAASQLDNSFNVEIIEQIASDKKKVGLMSEMLAKTINIQSKNKAERAIDDISIHSLGCGNVSGKTAVMFIGNDETITITHEAHNRTLYAQGACDIIKFIAGKPVGLYDITNIKKTNN